jgi:hypothetical protein
MLNFRQFMLEAPTNQPIIEAITALIPKADTHEFQNFLLRSMDEFGIPDDLLDLYAVTVLFEWNKTTQTDGSKDWTTPEQIKADQDPENPMSQWQQNKRLEQIRIAMNTTDAGMLHLLTVPKAMHRRELAVPIPNIQIFKNFTLETG